MAVSDHPDISHSVALVSATGRVQPVQLNIRRDGLWLYTQGGKEIQQLPYQHIIKWLPSKLRSKDPGPDDCLDVQVETTAGRKDLRMRCDSAQMVQTVITEIRSTVQGIMSELGSRQQTASGSSSGQQAAVQQGAGATHTATQPAQQQQQQLDGQEQQQQRQQQQAAMSVPQQQQEQQQQQRLPLQERQVQQQAQAEPGELQQYSMKLAVPSQQPQEQAPPPPQQQQRRQTADVLTAAQQQLQHLFQQQPSSAGHEEQQQQHQQEQLQPAEAALLHVGSMHSSSPVKLTQTGWISASLDTSGIAGNRSPAAAGPRSAMWHSFPTAAAGLTQALSPLQAALLSKETELELPAAAAAVLSGAGGMPAVDLARLGVGTVAAEGWQQAGAAAAAPRGSEAAAQIRFLEELVKRLSGELAARLACEGPAATQATLQAAASAAAAGAAAADVPLPPWIGDSRYLNPLLAAYDARLSAAQAEVSGRAEAARDIQDQIDALVSENVSLHEQLGKATARLADAAVASRVTAAAASTDADRARFQERLELLESENDLLLAQQGELEEEMGRLGKLLQAKDSQVAQLQAAAAAAGANVTALRAQLVKAERGVTDRRELKEQVQELSTQLAAETARAAAAAAAADAAAASQAAAQRELAATQAASKSVQTLQADLARARSVAEAAGEEASGLRVEADSLRKALRAMEGRLAEYQAKDTEVYLRIKAAMELAEEARLERDAATSTTAALRQQLEATQARLADVSKQLFGGSAADGGLGAAELRQKLGAAEREAARANRAAGEAEAKVAELQALSAKLTRDKTSLTAELTTLRDELGCCCCGAGGSTTRSPVASPIGTPGRIRAEMLSDRLLDAERQRDDIVQRLDSHKRAAARAEKDWELERNNLHAEVQRLSRKASAAEAAAAAAAAAAADSRQATAAAEAELAALRGAAARVEDELRAQLADNRAARDAEVSSLALKLERALAACDKAVGDAQEVIAGKEALLAEWKREAQLVSSKLESVLQQQSSEREEQQEQLQELSQQLADTQDQVALLQQELDAARAACAEEDMLLQEAEGRVAAAQTAALAAQEQAVQEVGGLHNQLEQAQLDRLKAERQRDSLAAKLERVLQQQQPTRYTHQQPPPLQAAAAAPAAPHVGADGEAEGAAEAAPAAAAAGGGLSLRDRRRSGWTSSSSSGGSSSPGKASAAAAAAAVAAAAELMEEHQGPVRGARRGQAHVAVQQHAHQQ